MGVNTVNGLVQNQVEPTGLVQTQVPQGQGNADPQRQLNPDQQTGLEGVTIVPNVELRNDATQVLLELEPEEKPPESGPR